MKNLILSLIAGLAALGASATVMASNDTTSQPTKLRPYELVNAHPAGNVMNATDSWPEDSWPVADNDSWPEDKWPVADNDCRPEDKWPVADNDCRPDDKWPVADNDSWPEDKWPVADNDSWPENRWPGAEPETEKWP